MPDRECGIGFLHYTRRRHKCFVWATEINSGEVWYRKKNMPHSQSGDQTYMQEQEANGKILVCISEE